LAETLTSTSSRPRPGTHSTDPHHKQNNPNTRLQEGQYECTVPTIADRIAQTVVALRLEARTETIFHPDSYGYRPRKSAHDALRKCRERCWRKDWVLDLDIRKFFDSLDHDLVVRTVAYGTFYGPGASDVLLEMLRKQLPVVGGGTGVWSFIEVTDAAAATIAAVGHGAPGIYNVVDDDPAPVAEWLPYLAKVAGAKPPLRVPAWLGRLLAGEFVVAQMTTSRGSSNEKARKELGWVPRYASWREGFRAWVSG
jgi:hypothetical protein